MRAGEDEQSDADRKQTGGCGPRCRRPPACYRIDHTRARSAARELLGDFHGLLISDRYSVYDFIDPDRRQVCLSHLARNFQGVL